MNNFMLLKRQITMWRCIVFIFFLLAGLSVLMTVSGESSSQESDFFSNSEDIIPTDKNSSVQYLLYTPENPKNPCYIEPKPSSISNSAFNSSYETKIIIHGYLIELKPGNLFEKMKDILLDYDKYNVIIVNWTKYNQQGYLVDVVNAYIVGVDVAGLINFLVSYTGVGPESFHIIGHSLGAQIGGVAGKHVMAMGRVTGLDPAGPGYKKLVGFDRLTSNSAQLVDAIHTSNADNVTGFGTLAPMAQINFFPNGGQVQPKCAIGQNYSDGDGIEHTIETPMDKAGCDHDSAITYFISSIFDCEYLSTFCKNYMTYENGQCNPESQPVNRMGFHCEADPGLPEHSKFYLNTVESFPYC